VASTYKDCVASKHWSKKALMIAGQVSDKRDGRYLMVKCVILTVKVASFGRERNTKEPRV
jgi:hypothetical protein